MKKLLLYTALVILATTVSCKNDTVDLDSEKKETKEHKDADADLGYISTDFKDGFAFKTNEEKELLAEVKLCDLAQADLENKSVPACDPKFFRLFKVSDKIPLKDAFLVLVKSEVHDFPIRRVFVFTRENNQLIQSNRFMGNLISLRESTTGFQDLVIRFRDKEGYYYNCSYAWKDNKYQFVQVEQIDDANIKPKFQEEMNVEIQKLIEDLHLSV